MLTLRFMKKLELRLKKEKIESLNVSEMKSIKAGIMNDSNLQPNDNTSTQLLGSRLFCTSNYEGSCRKSKSCKELICIPI